MGGGLVLKKLGWLALQQVRQMKELQLVLQQVRQVQVLLVLQLVQKQLLVLVELHHVVLLQLVH